MNKREKKPKEKKGPIVVRGLGRFMELKNLAKKKEEDKKQREREVFGLERKDFRRTHTVPKPFNFASTRRTDQQIRREQELREREMKECTFRPRRFDDDNFDHDNYDDGMLSRDRVSDGFRVLYDYDDDDDYEYDDED